MRRRTKYTWFPNVGSITGQPGVVTPSLLVTDLPVPANTSGQMGGPINSIILPVVLDEPLEPSGSNEAGDLARILGQEYILERIVGSAFIAGASLSTGVEDEGPKAILAVAGFFVARADSDVSNNQPVGSADVTANFSPLNVNNVREPWIWRRSWVLGTEFDAFQPIANGFPQGNGFYGSVMDGPHIDARSVRRVGNDERLWFILSVMSLSVNDNRDGTVQAVIDYRVLGRIVKAHNKSAF